MILVAGATGLLGAEICRRLRSRNLPVRALVRPASKTKATELELLGVEISAGDLRNRADVERACHGGATIISTATAMGAADKSLTLRSIDHDGQLQLIDAAKTSGVSQFIYISASPNLPETAPLIRYKRIAERAVRESGMRWTILQPSCFIEVWLGAPLGWDLTSGKATIFGAGHGRIPWISINDVAEVAVRAVSDARLANRDVPMAGPESLSPREVVQVFERVTGRSFSRKHIPRPVLALLGPIVARFNEGAGSGMGLGAFASLGETIDSPLQKELQLAMTTVEDYAMRATRG
jgi:uncharacterized protein YbjT (DUF2867 family)